MTATALMRSELQELFKKAKDAHPGLLLQKGLSKHDPDDSLNSAKAEHIARLCAIPASRFYERAFQRWKKITADTNRFLTVELILETRLLTGSATGGALETGCALHHTYGTPYLAGSGIKGVVNSHVRKSGFCDTDPDIRDELFGAEANEERPQGLSGLITFHDAWWIPGSTDTRGQRGTPLVADIVNCHHRAYYTPKNPEKRSLPSDFDDPIPNKRIAVRGSFLFVIEGPLAWLPLALDMLIEALQQHGFGARTSRGFGRLTEDQWDRQSRLEALRQEHEDATMSEQEKALAGLRELFDQCSATRQNEAGGKLAQAFNEICAQAMNWPPEDIETLLPLLQEIHTFLAGKGPKRKQKIQVLNERLQQ